MIFFAKKNAITFYYSNNILSTSFFIIDFNEIVDCLFLNFIIFYFNFDHISIKQDTSKKKYNINLIFWTLVLIYDPILSELEFSDRIWHPPCTHFTKKNLTCYSLHQKKSDLVLTSLWHLWRPILTLYDHNHHFCHFTMA